MPFKDMLKFLREERGLSQDEFARLTQLSKSTISMYENGNREPKFETLEAIADFFNVDMNTLLDKQISDVVLTQQEENHIKKYRQLDADGKRIIDEQVDFQLFKQQQNAEKDEENLG
mgnify:CR=1 FL=1